MSQKGPTRLATSRWPSVPPTMMAVRLHPPGGIDDLVYEEVPTPSPGPGQALIRVHAAAITRDELTWPADRLPATPSYELSGTVVAIGDGISGWEVGTDVYAMTDFEKDGVASDYAVVAPRQLSPKPASLDHVSSAALPLPGLSALQGLFDHGRLQKNQRVLIHGGTGGVGAYAVQLARLHGAYVITTVSSSRVEAAHRLGADRVVDYLAEGLESIGQVDLVFDTAGGERLRRSLDTLRPGGRLISVAEEPPLEEAAATGIEAKWFLVQSRTDQLAELASLVDAGVLGVPVSETFPMSRAAEAFRHVMSAGGSGKVVLVNA